MQPKSTWGFALLRECLLFACPNKSHQNKRHPVLRRRFAPMPCAAPAASGPAGNSPRCARLRHPAVLSACGLHCSALRPRDPIQASSLSLAQGRAFCAELGVRLIRRERSRWVRSGSVGALVSVVGRVSVFVPRCAATETRSGEGFPAHCAGAARCLSIAKAMRVFAASLRREHRSAPARSVGAVFGCLFPLLTFFWTSKRK